MPELTPALLALAAVWYAVFLFSTTLHEAAHAWAALRLGDPTAYEGGQVSLNPIPHLRREPFGMGVMPWLSFLLVGWTLGWASAPYDPVWADRYPKRAAWMALAGPASNLLLVVVSGVAIRIGMGMGTFIPAYGPTLDVVEATTPGMAATMATLLSVMFLLNLILFLFNLLPLPPLDGSAALALIIGDDAARRFSEFMRQPMMGLLGLLVAWRFFGVVFAPAYQLALRLLFTGA